MPISRLSAHTAEKERLSMTFQIAFTMVYLRKTPQSEQSPSIEQNKLLYLQWEKYALDASTLFAVISNQAILMKFSPDISRNSRNLEI